MPRRPRRDDFPSSETASFFSLTVDEPLETSPTDGYFSSRQQQPREMFIDTEAANKGTKVRITSPRSASRYSEEATPLLDSFLGQGPPPTYLEATTPNPWNARAGGDEAAGLLSHNGRDSPVPSEGGHYKLTSDKRRSLRDHCTRKRMIKVIAAIIAIIILAAILAAVTHGGNKQAVVNPIPTEPEPVAPAPVAPSPPKGGYPIRWPASCGKDYNARSDEHSYGSIAELSIQEAIRQMQRGYKRVSGWVHVVRAPDGQPAGTIQARFSYAASSSVDINSIKYAWSSAGLAIGEIATTDSYDGIDNKRRACLGMSVVLYVAPGTELENFMVSSVHMGMQIHNGVDFTVTNSTSVSLTTGTLDASFLNSRETRLETISGSISGKYALLDLLSVNTKSGSVNINVQPKEAAKDSTAPALFQAKSLSGSLRADFERNSVPERDYQVVIDTEVGSVDGTFIHGSTTHINSVAGLITADILPFNSGDYASTLSTSTTSGQTTLKLRAPYKRSQGAISKLTSTHKSVSGALDLTYPQEWEGHLIGNSLSGAVHLQGKDLELLHEEQDVTGGSRIEAKKGKGQSSMSFNTVSGGCEVKVGKL